MLALVLLTIGAIALIALARGCLKSLAAYGRTRQEFIINETFLACLFGMLFVSLFMTMVAAAAFGNKSHGVKESKTNSPTVFTSQPARR
jgi:hypothetical protein